MKNEEKICSIETLYKREIDIPILTKEEEVKLAYKILEGDKSARKTFIEKNLKFVVYIANNYKQSNLPFLDLIQEGNLGLMKAVDRFDVSKGYRFSTYASFWIKQSIINYLAEQGKAIKLTPNKFTEIIKIQKLKYDLCIKLNREPTLNDIAEEMKISLEEACLLSNLGEEIVSINTLIKDEEQESEFHNFILDPSFDVENLSEMILLRKEVNDLLKNCGLSKREIMILKLRYGFYSDDEKKFVDIAKIFGVSSERVRQIHKNAINKIRNSKRIDAFCFYMDKPEDAIKRLDRYRKSK